MNALHCIALHACMHALLCVCLGGCICVQEIGVRGLGRRLGRRQCRGRRAVLRVRDSEKSEFQTTEKNGETALQLQERAQGYRMVYVYYCRTYENAVSRGGGGREKGGRG